MVYTLLKYHPTRKCLVESNNALIIVTCCFLARSLTLLEQGEDWLAWNLDNITEWDSRSWFLQPDLPDRQHYKVAFIVHCHKSVIILI